jgi:small-conductance mechanosensitive channel
LKKRWFINGTKIGGLALATLAFSGCAETTANEVANTINPQTAKELKKATDKVQGTVGQKVVVNTDGSVEIKEMTQAEKELQKCLQGSIADFREIYDTEKKAMQEARSMCNGDMIIPTDDEDIQKENQQATASLAKTTAELEELSELKTLTLAYEDMSKNLTKEVRQFASALKNKNRGQIKNSLQEIDTIDTIVTNYPNLVKENFKSSFGQFLDLTSSLFGGDIAQQAKDLKRKIKEIQPTQLASF